VAFFRTLINWDTIADATAAAQSESSDIDLAANLAILANARIVAAIMAPKAAQAPIGN